MTQPLLGYCLAKGVNDVLKSRSGKLSSLALVPLEKIHITVFV
jgi:hypothetical protein